MRAAAGGVVLGAVACALLVTACGSGDMVTPSSSPATSSAPSGVRIDLPVSDWTSDQMRFAFYIEGRLIADGDCIRLNAKKDGSMVTLVWPKGTTALRTAKGITVYDAAGRAVASTGDAVFYDGGYGEAPYPNACTRGGARVFLVQDDL